MENEKVSIMVPCYNGEKYLDKFLSSILNQTYNNIELIITNDGSTDNSKLILSSYQKKFAENKMSLKVLFQTNNGQASAINKCLKEVTGKYLMWADCDDYYEIDAVESLVNCLATNEQCKLVRGKARFIDYETKMVIGISKPKCFYNPDVFDSYVFETDSYCLPGVNITYTDFFDKCVKTRHIYESKGGQNWQLLLPLMYNCETIFLDKVVYNYNIISNSHSHSINGLQKSLKRCDTLQDILFHVIDDIGTMQNYNKNEYKKKIRTKYLKRKIKILKNTILKRKTNKPNIKTVCKYDECTGCGACANKCVVGAIDMIDNGEGFYYPEINKEKCTECGLCIKTCPVLNEESMKKEISAYACYNKNSKERQNSSSGGVFILLAKEVIKKGGVVFGACFDDSFDVVHDYAEKENELAKFMTSKYVQSDIKDSYKKAIEFLEDKRIVYFSGTPCQIEGLLHFLGKSYDNLITQDIICHGVPSPRVWKKYKEYRYIKDGNAPLKINFRNKDDGWNNFNFSMKYNNYSFKAEHNKDLFMQSFLKNTCLRESCYNCSFKTIYRNSDITLGDFWGVERTYPNLDYDGGISAVIVNSDKGKGLFDAISSYIFSKEVDFENIIRNNSAYYMSSQKDIGRAKFFKHLDSMDFDRLVKKYVGKKQNIIKRILRKVF